MAITASDVNKLRQQTGAGMMDCKNALVESNGDFEAAVLSYMKAEHSDLMKQINDSGSYNDDIAAGFKAALDKFVSTQTW